MKAVWIIIFCLIATIWGSTMTFIKSSLEVFSAFELIVLRLGIASIAVFPYLLIKKPRIHKKDFKWVAMLSLTMYPVYQLGLIIGELEINAGLAGLIVSFNPILATFFSLIFFKEKITNKQLLGFGIALLGMALLCGLNSVFQEFNFYILWILLAVFAGAISLNLEKFLLKTYDVCTVLPTCIFLGGVWAVFFIPNLSQKFFSVSTYHQLVVVYLALLPIIAAHIMLAFMIQSFSMKLASSVIFIVPILGLYFAWIILNEIPTLVQYLGISGIFLGMYFILFQREN